MSSQTIINKDFRLILNKIENFYIDQADKYILEEDFAIGKGIDLGRFIVLKKIEDIINSNRCYEFDLEEVYEKFNLISSDE